ncbi:hypothetical protein [uncultured Mucilaginibacter sp.]|uniref:hypothetical protein n=1 Tax=uncultured Mucilaginibacter sp. TaxID=797541 RepID=UPI0025DFF228|nr:hypothetical protein [uncultured Mucilaginibacter sp.]
MKLNQILLMAVVLFVSCRNQTAKKVLLLDIDVLNGNVKEVVEQTGASIYKADFDKKGDLKQTWNKVLLTWSDKSGNRYI